MRDMSVICHSVGCVWHVYLCSNGVAVNVTPARIGINALVHKNATAAEEPLPANNPANHPCRSSSLAALRAVDEDGVRGAQQHKQHTTRTAPPTHREAAPNLPFCPLHLLSHVLQPYSTLLGGVVVVWTCVLSHA